ncbi:MAG: glutathione S-transferase [Betaproteobacteria bacterium]|nr:MAG: glutathione S-transferase [Betaproteobacteria bacterium]
MPKLIASLTSPFARKVRIVATEKHIEFELVIDPPAAPDTHVPEFNPLGKVPVWVMDDGHSLFDSRVICEHLDNISPAHPLIPREHRPRIAVKRWEALADGINDAAALIFMERKRPAAQQSPEWIARQFGKIQRGLAAMATDLGPRDWCCEHNYTLADIAVGCALGYLDLRFSGEIDWRRNHPTLSELYDRLMQLPSFKDSAP